MCTIHRRVYCMWARLRLRCVVWPHRHFLHVGSHAADLLDPSPARDPGPGLSWKVRCRTLLWFFSQMIKHYEARSLLYRRQILQENIRWKALGEIYKIYMLLHRSDLNISEFFRQTFSHFLAKFRFAKMRYCFILFIDFCSDVDEILSEFRRYFRKCWNFLNFLN